MTAAFVSRRFFFLFVGGSLVLTIFFLFNVLPRATLSYDEADYATAAAQGLVANYTDSPTISLLDFLVLGLANRAARTNSETQGQGQETLSEYIRTSGDITFYRHFHPPLYFYGLSLAGQLSGFDERILRFVSTLAIVLAAVLSGLFAAKFLLYTGAGAQTAHTAGFVALVFSLSSPLLLATGMVVTPHSLFSALVAATLGCAGMFLASGERSWWRATAALLGLAFLTIEYAPILALSIFLAFLIIHRRSEQISRMQGMRMLGEAAGITSAVMLLLWPAGVLKLSLVKNYLFFAYFAIVRARDAYGPLSVTEVWQERITESPQLLLAVMAVIFLGWLSIVKKSALYTLPCVLYVVLFAIVNLQNHSLNPTYPSSLVAAFGMCCGVVTGMLLTRTGQWGGSVVGVLLVLMLGATAFLAWPPRVDEWAFVVKEQDQLLVGLRERETLLSQANCVSVPAGVLPSIHYYFPELTLRPYHGNSSGTEVFDRCSYVLIAEPSTHSASSLRGPAVVELAVGPALRYVLVWRE